jgi:hypothetical protein
LYHNSSVTKICLGSIYRVKDKYRKSLRLHAGKDRLLVSNDEMRDKVFQLLVPNMNNNSKMQHSPVLVHTHVLYFAI